MVVNGWSERASYRALFIVNTVHSEHCSSSTVAWSKSSSAVAMSTAATSAEWSKASSTVAWSKATSTVATSAE